MRECSLGELLVLFIAGILVGVFISIIWMENDREASCRERGGVYIQSKCLKLEVIQ